MRCYCQPQQAPSAARFGIADMNLYRSLVHRKCQCLGHKLGQENLIWSRFGVATGSTGDLQKVGTDTRSSNVASLHLEFVQKSAVR